ncbi:MAG TPA: metallophosphoesterase family protein [Gaiellaceae bacterium]|nr:metallophosphoesterase family protein [Gaiellaceae bacterium]
MRVAVISDIHGNLHALESVLRSVDAESPDALWCLGDLVGYGPRPNRCCALVAERADVCLIGNHDLGVLGRIDLEDFSPDAAASARWTAEVLKDEPRRYLESLSSSAVLDRAELYHASPRDPVWEYVLAPEVAFLSLEATEKPLVLVGHSHVALRFGSENLTLALGEDGNEVDLARERWLLNPGSVGQPRDGNPLAAWLLLDFDAQTAVYRRVEYPVEKTQAEIRERGLPEALALRLESGI